MKSFISFKTRSLFGVKDTTFKGLRSLVVYRYTSSSCGASYLRETSRHLSTRITMHLKTDEASQLYKRLMSSKGCRQKCKSDSFSIIDQATNIFQFKIKEVIHSLWEKPTLNQQLLHVNLKLSL